MLVDKYDDLVAYCTRHQGAPLIAFDTEFVRERTYYPRLEIMQLSIDEEIAIVDCQAIENLEPLWVLLDDTRSEKVLHSGSQDMELIYLESKRLPAPLFDTQIAGSMLGYGLQCGYGKLVHQILGHKVPKGETFSDWSRRPLHPQQIKYAAADVQHLVPLREFMLKKLEQANRVEWVYQECGRWTNPDTFEKAPPEKCYQKIKGRSGLDGESLSVLRSLAAWREEEAQRRNHPPGRVVGDHVLLSLAKGVPSSLDELRNQRGLHANEINRNGDYILRAITHGVERAKTDPVEIPITRRPRVEEEDDGLFKILSAVLQIEAEKAKVSPSVLATSQEVKDLIIAFRLGQLNGHPLLDGWRKSLAGDRLVAVLAGKVSIRVDPESGTLLLEDVDH